MDRTNRLLLKGSLTLLIAFNIFNLINFIFQFAMARMLSSADYGILAALFSIIYMTGIFSEPIQTISAKYSAVEKDNRKLKNFIRRALKKSLRLSSLVFIFYLFLSIPISFFIKIPYLLLSSTGLMIFAAFLPPITRGTMQGRKRFFSLGTNLIAEALIKISLAVILVAIGWSVAGAMTATILASILAFIFSIIAIKDILKTEEKFMEVRDIYGYSKPVFFIILSITLFISIDVVIARAVFDATTAGHYAIASTLAKIIFLGTQPISKAMFPISAEEKKAKDYKLIVNSSIFLILCSLIVLLFFYFLPESIVFLFSGRYIPESTNILFYLGIGTTLFSITNLAILYKLSKKKITNYLLFLAFPLIEIAILYLFSHNLVEFSIAFVSANAIFLWGSIFLLDR